MKKRYKILISVAILTTIILGLNYSGFCFREFKYLSDDEILKNYLDSAFLKRIMYDDYGGLPPKFYFIEENPTYYEIIKTLKHIADNDINTTVMTESYSYMGKPREQVTTESIYIFEALKKYYTIREVTNEVDAGDKMGKSGYIHRYADVPINQALIVANGDMYIIDIYGKDSVKVDENQNKINVSFFSEYNFSSNYIEYEMKNGVKTAVFGNENIRDFKKNVSSKLEYFNKYGKPIGYQAEITNCGTAKNRL